MPRVRSSLRIWLLSDWLGDVEARSGTSEVELLGDGEEVANQARLEIDSGGYRVVGGKSWTPNKLGNSVGL